MRKFLAIVVAVVSLAIGLTACGSSSQSVNKANAESSSVSDAAVKADVADLINPAGQYAAGDYWQVSLCVHKSGNEYACSAWKGSDQRTLDVTDDGNSVYEQGISKGEL